LHLYGAERGTLWIDADDNRVADRIVEYRDTNADGLFDAWHMDDDADGTPERTFRHPSALGDPGVALRLDWRHVRDAYRPLLERSLQDHAAVAAALDRPLTESPGNGRLEALRWALENRIHRWFESGIAVSRAASDGGRAEGFEHVRDSWERGQFEDALRRMGALTREAGQP